MKQCYRFSVFLLVAIFFFSLVGCAATKSLTEQIDTIADVANKRDLSSCVKVHGYLNGADIAGGSVDWIFTTHTWEPSACVETWLNKSIGQPSEGAVMMMPLPMPVAPEEGGWR